MGGLGSGRLQQPQYDQTANEGPRIDIRRDASNLPRKPGDLRFHSWRTDVANTVLFCDLDYDQATLEAQVWKRRSADLEHKLTQTVRLNATNCNFGSLRWWLVCPKCEQRAAVLYVTSSVACRKCCRFKYATQRMDAPSRAAERLQQLRRRLHGHPGLLQPFPSRPKWMRHRTYVGHIAEATELLRRWSEGCQGMLARTQHQLAKVEAALAHRDGSGGSRRP